MPPPADILDTVFGHVPANGVATHAHPPAPLAGSVDLLASGPAVLSIPDAKGELVAYRLTPVPADYSQWVVRLERADGKGDSYMVAMGRDGHMACSCKDFTYRGRQRVCKHCVFAKALEAFLRDVLLAFGHER